jgi:hypothetical protein
MGWTPCPRCPPGIALLDIGLNGGANGDLGSSLLSPPLLQLVPAPRLLDCLLPIKDCIAIGSDHIIGFAQCARDVAVDLGLPISRDPLADPSPSVIADVAALRDTSPIGPRTGGQASPTRAVLDLRFDHSSRHKPETFISTISLLSYVDEPGSARQQSW